MEIANHLTNTFRLVGSLSIVLSGAYKIKDNVRKVPWAVYTPIGFSLSEESDNYRKRPNDKVTHNRSLPNLERETTMLRSLGYYVTSNPIGRALWLFNPLADERSDEEITEQEESVLRAIETLELAESARGILEPFSATSLHGSVTMKPSTTLNMNVIPSNLKSEFSLKTASQVSDRSEGPEHVFTDRSIRKRLVEALSMSIMGVVCRDCHWLPAGLYTFMGPYMSLLGQDGEGSAESDDRGAPGKAYTVSLRFRWHSSGTFTISSLPCTSPNYRLLHDQITEYGFSSIPVDNHITVSPSGRKAIVLGYASDVGEEVKRSITESLVQQAIFVPKTVHWLYLRLSGADEPDPFSWPANLCAWAPKSPRNLEQSSPIVDILDAGPRADPLVRTEEWYVGRVERATALATLRKNERIASQLQDRDSGSEDAEVFDDLGHLDNPAIAQDMAGVYPTPPDGPVFHTSPASALPQPDGHPSTENAPLDPLNALSTVPDTVSPGIEHGLANFEHHGGESLFGDMDTDLFASNGLTEADFNFFDEPDIIEAQRSYVSSSAPLTREPSVAEAEAISEDQTANQPEPITRDPMHGIETQNAGGDEFESQSDSVSVRQLPAEAAIPLHPPSPTAGPDSRPMPHDGFEAPNHQSGEGSNNHIPVESSVDGFDAKYAEKGRFRFEQMVKLEGSAPTKYLHPQHQEVPWIGSTQGPNSEKLDSEQKLWNSAEASDDGSGDSMSSSSPGEEAISTQCDEVPMPVGRKRKLGQMDVGANPATPAYSCSSISPTHENFEALLSFPQPELFERNPSRLDENPRPHSTLEIRGPYRRNSLDAKAFLRVAQVLADQVIMQTSDPSYLPQSQDLCSLSLSASEAYMVGAVLASAMAQILPDAIPCRLKQLVAIDQFPGHQGTTGSTNTQKLANRPIVSRQSKAVGHETERLFHLDASLACVRRGDTAIDVATSALGFWEELSFAPLSGCKDIAAIAVFPFSSFIQERAASFLSVIGGTYQSLKLGSHKPSPDNGLMKSGLVPVVTTTNDLEKLMHDLCEACEMTGRLLAKSALSSRNFVVYMVDAFGECRSQPRLCEAFLRMFDAYAQSLKDSKRQNHNDLILQIVPLNLIASEQTLILPDPKMHRKLAFEVYDRCAPPIDPDIAGMTQFSCAPAVRLSKTVPRNINLQLTAKPPCGSPLSDRCIHVSYSHPKHSSWLTASWVDSYGSLQWNASYHLASDRGDVWPHFREAAEDIWETTVEATRFHSTPYRLLIVKCEPMPDVERKVWLSLADAFQSRILLTLLTIDQDPVLQFPKPALAQLSTSTHSATPTGATISSEQSGFNRTSGADNSVAAAVTPTIAFFENDTSARLVDINEETWGFNMGRSSDDLDLEVDSALRLFCGYLLKRTDPRDENGLIACEINLIHDQAPCEALLKEVLVMYGSLATLARIRGLVDPLKSVLPLHAAAAVKAHDTLSDTMQWGGT